MDRPPQEGCRLQVQLTGEQEMPSPAKKSRPSTGSCRMPTSVGALPTVEYLQAAKQHCKFQALIALISQACSSSRQRSSSCTKDGADRSPVRPPGKLITAPVGDKEGEGLHADRQAQNVKTRPH